MEDLNNLRQMGMISNEMVEEMQKVINNADYGKELAEASKRIEALQLKQDNGPKSMVPKHLKTPLKKNIQKRLRKQQAKV